MDYISNNSTFIIIKIGKYMCTLYIYLHVLYIQDIFTNSIIELL